MVKSRLLLSAVIVCGLSFVAQAKDFTQAEIYEAMCQKCHGKHAEGNPEKKGPALVEQTEAELAVDIYELESGGYQSSGSGHDDMEYNLEVIENKGMKVDADKMAKYIYTTFGEK